MMTIMTDAEWDNAVEALTRDTRIIHMLMNLPADWAERLPELVEPTWGGRSHKVFADAANGLYDLLRMREGEEYGEPRPLGLVPSALLRLSQEMEPGA